MKRKGQDMGAAERGIRLVCYLAARRTGVSYAELEAEFGVTERTLRRDLDLLRDCGFQVRATITDEGVHRFSLKSLPDALFAFAVRQTRPTRLLWDGSRPSGPVAPRAGALVSNGASTLRQAGSE